MNAWAEWNLYHEHIAELHTRLEEEREPKAAMLRNEVLGIRKSGASRQRKLRSSLPRSDCS